MATKITKYSVEATIPTAQYANVKPTIEFETDDLGEAMNMAVDHFIRLSTLVGENGATLKINAPKK